MKKIILFFITLCGFKHFSQSPAPPLINYQGVARNANGQPIVNQNIGLLFEILQGSVSGSSVYTEAQPITTNSLGLFSTQIGKPPANLGVVNWQNGPYFLKISMDASGGSNYLPLGTQQLVSVPYALYAEKSGNSISLPTATLNGTTLRYNSSNSSWIIDTNLINNGTKVKIGDRNNIQKNKLLVLSNNATDSAAIFGINSSAVSNGAAVRGFVSGSTAQTGTVTGIGIFGGHFVSYNSSGIGVGVLGQGSSSTSNGVGLMGIGSSTGTALDNNFAIGLFATTDPTCAAANKYAGFFDHGNVIINDTLQLRNSGGNVGDVLTKWHHNGKAIWLPASGNGPFTQSANYIHAANSFTNSRIVFGVPYPAGGFPFQSRVTVVNNSSNSYDTAFVVLQKNNTKPAIYASVLSSSASASPAIYGEVIGGLGGTTAGVYGKGNFNHGVIGYSGSFNGVWGQSPNGVGVSGESSANGQAGRFNLTSNSSGFPAVYIGTNSNPPALRAESFGNGSAIDALSSSASASTANNISLRLVEGHISSFQSVTFTTISSAFGSGFSFGSSGGNDVAGTLKFVGGISSLTPSSSGSLTVQFGKNYPTKPVVVVSALSMEWAQINHYVVSTTNGFTIFFKNNTTNAVTLIPLADAFSYFVIGMD